MQWNWYKKIDISKEKLVDSGYFKALGNVFQMLSLGTAVVLPLIAILFTTFLAWQNTQLGQITQNQLEDFTSAIQKRELNPKVLGVISGKEIQLDLQPIRSEKPGSEMAAIIQTFAKYAGNNLNQLDINQEIENRKIQDQDFKNISILLQEILPKSEILQDKTKLKELLLNKQAILFWYENQTDEKAEIGILTGFKTDKDDKTIFSIINFQSEKQDISEDNLNQIWSKTNFQAIIVG